MSESNGDGVVTFSEVVEERPVKIKDANGEVRDYVVRGMDGDSLSGWIDASLKRQPVDEKGRPVVKAPSVKDSQEDDIDLVQQCLFDINGCQVDRARIKSWPARTRLGLIKITQEVNGLAPGKG